MKIHHIAFVYTFVAINRADNFSDTVNDFGLQLLEYTHQEVMDNTVISPFGVWSLLISVRQGATGISRRTLNNVLELPNDELKVSSIYKNLTGSMLRLGETVQIRKSIVVNSNVKLLGDFFNIITTNYDTIDIYLDFKQSQSAAVVANRLILDSGVKVPNLLTETDFYESVLIFTNIIKFRGTWKSSFRKEDTLLKVFYGENSNNIKIINMMTQTGLFLCATIDVLQSTLLELPYNEEYSMLIILPDENVTMKNLHENFQNTNLRNILQNLNKNKDYVRVSLPRFKISSNLVLNRPLIEMGLNLFDNSAELKRASTDDIFISQIVHKVDIEVVESDIVESEEIHFGFSEARIFEANRPFVYAVIENMTKTFLVAGVYSKPI